MKVALILALCLAGAYSQVSEGDIQYFLWNSRTSRERIFPNNLGNNIINNAPVKFLVHGWTESINSFWYEGARNNYVRLGANVIGVDWSRHAQLTYPTAVARLNAIGSFIARFVSTLSTSRGIPASRVHFIGHSLGAHLSGFTGKNLLQQTGQRLGRITGLDPAGPSFSGAANSGRLWRTDADRVDTILSDAGFGGLGIDASLGHVNFWPNGGTASQPGCFIGKF
ncbi:lipase [Holotrichia oblita]|uniref:Lipase n=1 Tax=Holotrichia oblita TaxID=644536 RepID=A0ACB9T408_HOLOL|nr:lipase [Holotrichia oblita]